MTVKTLRILLALLGVTVSLSACSHQSTPVVPTDADILKAIRPVLVDRAGQGAWSPEIARQKQEAARKKIVLNSRCGELPPGSGRFFCRFTLSPSSVPDRTGIFYRDSSGQWAVSDF